MMMKKSWSRKAVSPVIATILMVAITVVLAAVLYVMVMGFGSSPATVPQATLTKDATNNRIYVSISPAADITKCKIAVNGTATALGTVSATGFTFVDVGGDSKVTTGDYWTVSNSAGTTFSLVYVEGTTSTSLATVTW